MISRTTPATLLVCTILGLVSAGCGGGSRNAPPIEGRTIPSPEKIPLPPTRKLVPIDLNLQAAARQAMDDALNDNNPEIRAHAIEGIRITQGASGGPKIIKGLDDTYDVVRYAAAMAVGELKLKDAQPKLNKMLDDPTGQVRVAVRFALHRLGDYTHSHDLEVYAQDANALVRASTATALGKLGEPSAIKILRRMRMAYRPGEDDKTDKGVIARQAASEALYLLGDETGMADLIGLTMSKNKADDQMVGLLGLGARRNHVVTEHIRAGLRADHLETRIVAARAMAMVCPESGPDSSYDLGYVFVMEGAKSKSRLQRHLAALALGEIARSDTQDTLRALLKDEEPTVRVAAATAVLQLGAHPRSVNGKSPGTTGGENTTQTGT